MAPFYALYVRRSDGKTEITVKGKASEPNQPTDDQLDQKPDKDGVSDFYREVAIDEPKHLDWRRKLGGMLARELDSADKTGNDHGHILVAFPEGFRLFEHVKRTEKDGKLEVKSKTHAAGGNDRQDAYLYGHPSGRRKRFRSPADFFPHVLWLCTDESGDPDNCTCKLCCPEELENLIPGYKSAADKPAKQESETKESKPALDVVVPVSVAPASRPGKSPSTTVQPTPAEPPTRVLNAVQPRSVAPSTLPPRSTQEQYLDSQYTGFSYRIGELVWFQRGQRWGLGIILRRWMAPPNQCNYQVQPLSYPADHPAPVVKSADSEMRPWLAWSVPKFTNDGLNVLPEPPQYDTVDWHAMMNKQYGNGDMEVDGSILAAKAIDSSYTMIDKIDMSSNNEPGVFNVETFYAGIFLGAEKIWIGDPVRLSIGSGTDIMVVQSILERTRISTTNEKTLQQSVYLIGDVYVLNSLPHSSLTTPTRASQANNPHLPTRLTEDLAFRNARSIPARHQASYWRLITSGARVDIEVIKGRWYEASRLLPILQPAVFDEAARKGDIQESSLWMNSRGDCVNNNRDTALARLPRQNVRKETRREALGRAVPADTDIYTGLDPPNVGQQAGAGALRPQQQSNDDMRIDPRFESAAQSDIMQQDALPTQLDGGAGLDEFMNLDSMDEHSQIPGFGDHSGFY